MTALVSVESFRSETSTWKAQGIWPSEDEMVLIIGIIIYYVFGLYKTFTSILSFASGWGHFSGGEWKVKSWVVRGS